MDAIIIIISGLLRLDHRNEETRNAFLCRPSAFGFAHLTDEGGSTSSKVEGGIVSHVGRFKNEPSVNDYKKIPSLSMICLKESYSFPN